MRDAVLGRAGLASDAEVLNRVNRVLGPVDVTDDESVRPTAGKVLKVVTRSGDSSFVKWYRDQTDYQREWNALTHYTPALGSDAPRLIDNDEGLKMLLISELQGKAAAGTAKEWDPLVHSKAGASPGGHQENVLLRVMLDSVRIVKDTNVSEQRDQAVLADGRGVCEVASPFGESRKSVVAWLRRYENHGQDGLASRSHQPKSMPHQMPVHMEAGLA